MISNLYTLSLKLKNSIVLQIIDKEHFFNPTRMLLPACLSLEKIDRKKVACHHQSDYRNC